MVFFWYFKCFFFGYFGDIYIFCLFCYIVSIIVIMFVVMQEYKIKILVICKYMYCLNFRFFILLYFMLSNLFVVWIFFICMFIDNIFEYIN